jgi:DNA-directed RNA polymerase subunit RPC12/RpoP
MQKKYISKLNHNTSIKDMSTQKVKEVVSTKEDPKYKCTECKYIMTPVDIKNDVKCVKCKNRILLKVRSSQGIEYLAR